MTLSQGEHVERYQRALREGKYTNMIKLSISDCLISVGLFIYQFFFHIS